MKHYVYKLTDKFTNEFYFGSRTCKCEPIYDSYMGSMKTWKPNKNNLVKEVVKSDFSTRELATKYEAELIKENIKNPLNRNYFIPTSDIGFYGHQHETEIKIKISESMKNRHVGEDNPFYGKKHKKESLIKISNSLKGKTHSKETKNKMSKSASEIDRSTYNLKRCKIVDLETNEIFNSIYEASKRIGMSRGYIHKNIGIKFKKI